MEKDSLRREIAEARRQSAQSAQELEEASERWRAERRRLNAEIDKLEGALAETRSIRSKAVPSNHESHGASEESVRLQLAATASEERLRKASSEWEAERGKLLAKVARLERTMTDLLERSNNPMRSAQFVIERLEKELKEAVETKQSVETELFRVQAGWEEERMKMAGELFRLRRGAGPDTREHDENEALRRARAEIEQLERKLSEQSQNVSADSVEQLRLQHASERQEISREKARLAEELQSATDLLNRERQRFAAAAAVEERLRKELSDWEGEGGKLLAEVERLDRDRQQIDKEKAQLAEELQRATDLLAGERQQFAAAATVEERLRKASLEREVEGDKLLAEIERLDSERQEIGHEKARLAEELQSVADQLNRERQQSAAAAAVEERLNKASSEWEVEQGKLRDEIERLEKERQEIGHEKARLAEELQSVTGRLATEQRDIAAAAAVEERLRKELLDWEVEGGKLLAEIERLESDRQEISTEKARLAEELQSSTDLLAGEQRKFAASADVEERLRKASSEWEVERGKLAAEIARIASDLQEIGQEKAQQAEDLQNATNQLERERQQLVAAAGVEERLRKASSEWEAERGKLAGEIERLESDRREIGQEKARLADELQSATDQLAGERQQSAAAGAAEKRFRKESSEWEAERGKLLAEVARLEGTGTDLLERSQDSLRVAQMASAQIEAKLQESVEAKQRVEVEFARIRAAWEEERRKIVGELSRLRRWAGPAAREREQNQDLQRARAEIERLERKQSEASEHVSADSVEQLRLQYTGEIQEILKEKDRLADELQSATDSLGQERQRLAAAAPSESDAIAAELARVRNAIAEIEHLLDDPATELSAMIRKNVERSGLDAYLKGMLFALGQGEK